MGHFSVLLLLPWYYYFFLFCSLFFWGSVSLALLLFLFFTLYFFISFLLSLSYFFSFRWFFSASASKTSKGGLQRFYYQKIKGNGEFVQGEVIIKKRMSNNKADRLGFTALPGKSDTDHAVFQMGTWKMNGWERGWPEKMRCSQEWMVWNGKSCSGTV